MLVTSRQDHPQDVHKKETCKLEQQGEVMGTGQGNSAHPQCYVVLLGIGGQHGGLYLGMETDHIS